MTAMLAQRAAPARRVILMGASNLTRAFPLLVDLLKGGSQMPLAIYAASGHGRSYGMRSFFLGQSLPGILQSDLWAALQRTPAAGTSALVTDVGNDILYHAAPDQIADWVDQCLLRLKHCSARTVLTTLPVCNLEGLGPKRFYFLRTLSFPRCRLSYDAVIERAQELNRRVIELGRRHAATVIDPRPDWYGFDPIHVVCRDWLRAWSQIMEPVIRDLNASHAWEPPCRLGLARAGYELARSLRWMAHPPQRRALLGIALHRPQPSVRLACGSEISFY